MWLDKVFNRKYTAFNLRHVWFDLAFFKVFDVQIHNRIRFPTSTCHKVLIFKGLSITVHDFFPLTYLRHPSFSLLKKNVFLFLQKCSEPFLKISFRNQTLITHAWNAILVPFKKWVITYCHSNLNLLHIVIANFPSVHGSLLKFLAVPVQFQLCYHQF